MNKFLKTAVAIILIFPSIVFATDDVVVDSCGGNQCYQIDTTLQAINLGGSANFGGYGAGAFEGQEGGVLINQAGYSTSYTNLNVAGNLCGVDCQDGSFTFNAQSGEDVTVQAGALSTIPGKPAIVVSEGGASSGASFIFDEVSVAPKK